MGDEQDFPDVPRKGVLVLEIWGEKNRSDTDHCISRIIQAVRIKIRFVSLWIEGDRIYGGQNRL